MFLQINRLAFFRGDPSQLSFFFPGIARFTSILARHFTAEVPTDAMVACRTPYALQTDPLTFSTVKLTFDVNV